MGRKNCTPTPRWLCSTCNLEENDMKMLVGIFSNALYTYAPRFRKFPKKDGWGWVYKSNRGHLRILLVKHTNIMYIYFFNFKSHFNWNMLIGCFLIDIARLWNLLGAGASMSHGHLLLLFQVVALLTIYSDKYPYKITISYPYYFPFHVHPPPFFFSLSLST
jgi:hypothetical protein